MNFNSVEEEIVKKFVEKNRQPRLIWELNNPKTRDSVFWRFSGPNIFKKSCLKPLEYMSSKLIERYLFQLSSAKEVYYIGEDYIGQLSLKNAATRVDTGEICIIYCGNGIGYYQGEQDDGPPPRFLLMQRE